MPPSAIRVLQLAQGYVETDKVSGTDRQCQSVPDALSVSPIGSFYEATFVKPRCAVLSTFTAAASIFTQRKAKRAIFPWYSVVKGL
jgi:hypothetical protein